jgi:hypothetical protein
MQKNVSLPANPVYTTNPSTNQRLPHLNIAMNIMQDELHNNKKAISSDLAISIPRDEGGNSSKKQRKKRTPTQTTGGGVPRGLKRQCSPATRAPSSQPHTISRLSDLIAICTDLQYKEIIHHLPEGWTTKNDRGSIVTKRQLEMAQWGAYKDD